MLPCARTAGLASLLEPHVVYKGDWHMQSTNVVRKCLDEACSRSDLRLKQIFSVVLAIENQSLVKGGKLHELLGVGASTMTKCPLAESSEVAVHIPGEITLIASSFFSYNRFSSLIIAYLLL